MGLTKHPDKPKGEYVMEFRDKPMQNLVRIKEKEICKNVQELLLDGEQIVVGIFVAVRYGCAISDVAKKVQKNVHTALEGMTGFKVAAVNVHVGGISFN